MLAGSGEDVIGSQEDAIAIAEEADVSIGVSGSPDDAVALASQVEVLAVLDQRDCVGGWDSDDMVQLSGTGV